MFTICGESELNNFPKHTQRDCLSKKECEIRYKRITQIYKICEFCKFKYKFKYKIYEIRYKKITHL